MVDDAVSATLPAVIPSEPLIDFSKLPPPAVVVRITTDGAAPATTAVVVPEDGDAVIVDFVRDGDLGIPMTLRLEEIGFTGNLSPWANGQYALSNAGLVSFPVGQERARITIRPADDPRREPDQQSTLRLRPVDAADTEYAIVNVTLEDDDRRAFENRLPANTLGFAQSQVSVNEADPAVQVDVMRFNPDDTVVVVGFTVEDLTATQGEGRGPRASRPRVPRRGGRGVRRQTQRRPGDPARQRDTQRRDHDSRRRIDCLRGPCRHGSNTARLPLRPLWPLSPERSH